MFTPAAVCASCLAPLRTGSARASDAGYVHADDLGCRIVTARLAGESLEQILCTLRAEGVTTTKLAAASGLTASAIEWRLSRRKPDDLAYIGGWVKQGLIWKPRRSDVA